MTVLVDIRIDLVPPYTVTGKSVLVSKRHQVGSGVKVTFRDLDLIGSCGHDGVVIPERKFAKRGQPSCPHPHLKLFVLRQIGYGILVGIAVRIPVVPVRRRHDFLISVRSLTVQLRVTTPRNAFASHIVCFCTIDGPGGIQSHRRSDRVIEQRVGNEAARVICLPVRGQLQRIASTRGDRAIAYELSIQLVSIQRFDISAVVLVEIGQAVVEENRWPNVIWNIE